MEVNMQLHAGTNHKSNPKFFFVCIIMVTNSSGVITRAM